jgi:hypothetical protein
MGSLVMCLGMVIFILSLLGFVDLLRFIDWLSHELGDAIGYHFFKDCFQYFSFILLYSHNVSICQLRLSTLFFFFLSLHMHGFLKFPVYMAAFEHLNSQILIQFLFWVFHISEYLLWVCPLSHLCSNLCKMKSREPAHEMSPSHVKAEVRTALFPLAQGQHLWTRPLLKTKTSSTLGRI